MATAAAKPYVSCPATNPATSRSAADNSHVVVVVVLVELAEEVTEAVRGTAEIRGWNAEEEGGGASLSQLSSSA